MMNIKPPEGILPQKEAFNAEFKRLLEDWKSKWKSELTGPFPIRKGLESQLSQETIDELLPEIEAKKAIVEFCTVAIKEATTNEERIGIVDMIKINLGFGLDGGMKTTVYELMTDIFKNTLLKQN